jgi:hypothetical protein
VSLTVKVRLVAVLASPALGDQSTDTFEGSPPFPEVIPVMVNPMTHAEFIGDTLKVGKETALFEPPMVKS